MWGVGLGSRWVIDRALRAMDAFPVNIGLLGRGSSSDPDSIRESLLESLLESLFDSLFPSIFNFASPPLLDLNGHRNSLVSLDLSFVSSSANVSWTKILWLFKSRWMIGGS